MSTRCMGHSGPNPTVREYRESCNCAALYTVKQQGKAGAIDSSPESMELERDYCRRQIANLQSERRSTRNGSARARCSRWISDYSLRLARLKEASA